VGDRPRLLDAFGRRGGAARGYQQAGWHVTVVDIDDFSDNHGGDLFVQADAITYIRDHGHHYQAIHAGPPCQGQIAITSANRTRPGWHDQHRNLIPATRRALAEVHAATGIPTVIENGASKHLRPDMLLCGETFGLGVIRHRYFEVAGLLPMQPPHSPHRGRIRGWRHGAWFDGPYLAVYGDSSSKGSVAEWQAAMGIDWMDDRGDLAEAIPPAYTRWIGDLMMAQLRSETAA
jgi:DNA (cytosine-5)-methyltransferase 1